MGLPVESPRASELSRRISSLLSTLLVYIDRQPVGSGDALLCCPQVFEAGPNQAPDGAGLSVEPPRASELSKRINALLSSLRAGRSTYASCFVVKQGASNWGPQITLHHIS